MTLITKQLAMFRVIIQTNLSTCRRMNYNFGRPLGEACLSVGLSDRQNLRPRVEDCGDTREPMKLVFSAALDLVESKP